MLTSHELFGFMPAPLAGDILEHAYTHDRDLYRATLTAVANARKVRRLADGKVLIELVEGEIGRAHV